MKRSGLYAFLISAAFCMMCKVPYTQQTYTASTPAEPHIRTFLNISQRDSIDFIRWELNFIDQDSFIAKVNYGIGQPNTSGFINGGKYATITGFVAGIDNGHKLTTGNNVLLSLVKINESLLHVMSHDGTLLAGNDGFNYTFSKQSSANNYALKIPAFTSTDKIAGMYAGRTPCTELTNEYKIAASRDCFKLKWLLTLNRDDKTNEPSTFRLNYTLHRANIIEGTWKIDNDNILTLYNKGNEFIKLIGADNDVLFFVDKQNRLFNGNENFSYALNRR